MVNQVGSPAMFEGNRFLPETGIPIWKMERIKTVLELCEPEPLTVATWILMLFTTGFCSGWRLSAWRDTSVVAIPVLPCPWSGFLRPRLLVEQNHSLYGSETGEDRNGTRRSRAGYHPSN